MTPPPDQPRRVLVIMSDTGGGHRAAAEAIQNATERLHPGQLVFDLVDVFRDYTPPPFRFAPRIYPTWVNYAAPTWGMSFAMTNDALRSRMAVNFFYLYWRRGLQRLFREHPADLVIGVHSILTRPVMKALRYVPNPPPFVSVVTDLMSTHAFWYDPGVTRCLVPTPQAYERGLQFGLQPHQLRLTGLPIHPKFLEDLTSKAEARRALGLCEDLPLVLLVSGGEGMGPLFKIAEAINQKRAACQMVVVAGRNDKLRHQLEQHHWNQPTKIYGFVDFMPKLMAAADMLVTKAGPATITEAFTAGLPIIISGAIPGQEAGNVDLVVANGAGVFAPSPQGVAQTVLDWLQRGADELRERAEKARQLAKPQAVWEIAEEVHHLALYGQVAAPLPTPESRSQALVTPIIGH